MNKGLLENLTLYHNYQYNETHKNFNGNILYEAVKAGKILPYHDKFRFVGDRKSNCTIRIYPVSVNESGCLGLRVTTKNDKWMERIDLNVSSKALGSGVLCLRFGREGRWKTSSSWDRGWDLGFLQRQAGGASE